MSFFQNYTQEIKSLLINQEDNFLKSVYLLKKLPKKNKIIICGNGGSSSIASHVATDFTKILKIRTLTFADDNLITCFANDYGYENWTMELIKINLEINDLVILISSSGMSNNIINAAKYVKRKKNKLITLTGFSNKNSVKRYGNINVWVDSKKYNFVETAHQIFLLAIIDYLA